jgi:hypothetical protein
MPQRRLALLAVAATLAACMPGQPTGSAPAAGSPAPADATAGATAGSSQPSPSAVASAPATDLVADDDVADTDRQELLSLFGSSDVQVYLPNDVISDGSGAYFGIEALPASRPAVKFRRRTPQTLSQQLRLAYATGNRDRAVATMTIRQRVIWDIITPAGSREVSAQVRQVRELQALRSARKWRLDRVGAVRLQPDNDAAGLTIQSLTLQANDEPLVTIQKDTPAADITGIPTIKGGQQLTASVTVNQPTGDPAPFLLGLLRAPGLGGADRLTPSADGTTFSRTIVVPNKPGLYHVGADVVNLSALTGATPQAVFANWSVTLKVL